MQEREGSGQVPSLLAERAASEGPRSMRAVEDNLGRPLQYRREEWRKEKEREPGDSLRSCNASQLNLHRCPPPIVNKRQASPPIQDRGEHRECTVENSTVAPYRLGIAQHLQNTLGEVFIDFGVTRYRLRNIRDGIVIPIVLSTVANEQATIGFELSDEIFAFHRSVSSASLRTPGISPLVRSRYRSRRWDCRSSNDSPCVQ